MLLERHAGVWRRRGWWRVANKKGGRVRLMELCLGENMAAISVGKASSWVLEVWVAGVNRGDGWGTELQACLGDGWVVAALELKWKMKVVSVTFWFRFSSRLVTVLFGLVPFRVSGDAFCNGISCECSVILCFFVLGSFSFAFRLSVFPHLSLNLVFIVFAYGFL